MTEPQQPPVIRVEKGSSHSYQTPDGDPVLGVTTILSKAIPKPALVPWAAKATAGYAVDNWDTLGGLPPSERIERIKKEWRGVRDRAAIRGTRVHALGEALAHGRQVEVADELLPYVEPYARWLTDWDVRPLVTEAVVWSEQPLYAGTLDMIAYVADPQGEALMLLDLKTSGSGVWPETALQLSAYRFADELVTQDGKTQDMPDVMDSAVIWLPGDGTCHMVPVDSSYRVFKAFEAACEVATWTRIKKSDLIGRAVSPPVREIKGQEPLS